MPEASSLTFSDQIEVSIKETTLGFLLSVIKLYLKKLRYPCPNKHFQPVCVCSCCLPEEIECGMGREVGGGVQDGEHMYTRGRFMLIYGKTNTIL